MAEEKINLKHAVYGKFGGATTEDYSTLVTGGGWDRFNTEKCNDIISLKVFDISGLYDVINPKLIVENPEHPIEVIFRNNDKSEYIFLRCFPSTFKGRDGHRVDNIYHAIIVSEKELASINYDLSKISSNFITAFNKDTIIGPDDKEIWLNAGEKPTKREIQVVAENLDITPPSVVGLNKPKKISTFNSNDALGSINNLPLPQKILLLHSNVITNIPGHKLFIENANTIKSATTLEGLNIINTSAPVDPLNTRNSPSSSGPSNFNAINTFAESRVQEKIGEYRSSVGFVSYSGEQKDLLMSNKFQQLNFDELKTIDLPEQIKDIVPKLEEIENKISQTKVGAGEQVVVAETVQHQLAGQALNQPGEVIAVRQPVLAEEENLTEDNTQLYDPQQVLEGPLLEQEIINEPIAAVTISVDPSIEIPPQEEIKPSVPKLSLREEVPKQKFFKPGQADGYAGGKIRVELADGYIPNNENSEAFKNNLMVLQAQFSNPEDKLIGNLTFTGGFMQPPKTIMIPINFPPERLEELDKALKSFNILHERAEARKAGQPFLTVVKEAEKKDPAQIPVTLNPEEKTLEIRKHLGILVSRDAKNPIRFDDKNGTITIDLDKIYAAHSQEGHPTDILLPKDKVAIENALRGFNKDATITGYRNLTIPADADIEKLSKVLMKALTPAAVKVVDAKRAEDSKKKKKVKAKQSEIKQKEKDEQQKFIEVKKAFKEKEELREKIRTVLEYIDTGLNKDKNQDILFLENGIQIALSHGFASIPKSNRDKKIFLERHKAILTAELERGAAKQQFGGQAYAIDNLNIVVPYGYDMRALNETLRIVQQRAINEDHPDYYQSAKNNSKAEEPPPQPTPPPAIKGVVAPSFEINKLAEELRKSRIVNGNSVMWPGSKGVAKTGDGLTIVLKGTYIPDILKNQNGTLKNSQNIRGTDKEELNQLRQTLAGMLKIDVKHIKFISGPQATELLIHKDALKTIYDKSHQPFKTEADAYETAANTISRAVEYEMRRANQIRAERLEAEKENNNTENKKPELSNLVVSADKKGVSIGRRVRDTVVNLPKDIVTIGKNLWKNKDELAISVAAVTVKLASRAYSVTSLTSLPATFGISTAARGALKNEQITKQRISEYRDSLLNKLNSGQVKNHLAPPYDIFKNADWKKITNASKQDTYRLNIQLHDANLTQKLTTLFNKQGIKGGFDAHGNGVFNLSKKQFRELAESVMFKENGSVKALRDAKDIFRPSVVNTASLGQRLSGEAVYKGAGNFAFGAIEIAGFTRNEKTGKIGFSLTKLRNSLLVMGGLHLLGDGIQWLRDHIHIGGHATGAVAAKQTPVSKVDTAKPSSTSTTKPAIVAEPKIAVDTAHANTHTPAAKIDTTAEAHIKPATPVTKPASGLPATPTVTPKVDSVVTKQIDNYIHQANSSGNKIDVNAHGNLLATQKISQIQLASQVLDVKVGGHEIAWNDKLNSQTEAAITKIFEQKGIEIPKGYVCEANLDKIHAVVMEECHKQTTKLQEVLRDKFDQFSPDFKPTGNPGERTLAALRHAAEKIGMKGDVHFNRVQEFLEKSESYTAGPKNIINQISSSAIGNPTSLNK